MEDLVISDQTKRAINDYLKDPSQSIGLIGQPGLHKSALADYLAKQLLDLDDHKLVNYPYILRINDPSLKSIGIDAVRQINSFTSLKVPLKRDINRIVIVSNAQLMTIEAQNALLKGLEEPPIGTVFILTASAVKDLLPTIVSRLQLINIQKPSKSSLIDHYSNLGHDKSEIEQAYLISGGLPGIMELMLGDDQHPLNQATQTARMLLSGTTFDRLNSVNELAKDKQRFRDVLFIIKQMAKLGLSSTNAANVHRWQKILAACVDSEQKLNANVQTKLLLTDFMLSLG